MTSPEATSLPRTDTPGGRGNIHKPPGGVPLSVMQRPRRAQQPLPPTSQIPSEISFIKLKTLLTALPLTRNSRGASYKVSFLGDNLGKGGGVLGERKNMYRGDPGGQDTAQTTRPTGKTDFKGTQKQLHREQCTSRRATKRLCSYSLPAAAHSSSPSSSSDSSES